MQPDTTSQPQPATVYIYALKCPDTLQVRYIGKSTDPRARLRHHLDTGSRQSNTHKNHWINSLLAVGKRPFLEVLETTTEVEWPQREQYYIQCYKALGRLTNSTNGGEGAPGCPQSPETVAKRVAKNTGRKRTPEQIANMKAGASKRLSNSSYRDDLIARTKARVCKKVHRFDAMGCFIDSFPSVAAMCRALQWPKEQVTNKLGWARGTGWHLEFQLRYATSCANEQEEPVCLEWVRPTRVRQKRTPEQCERSAKAGKSRTPAQLAQAKQNSRKVIRFTANGELMDAFCSIEEMCRETDLRSWPVYSVLNGRQKTYRGFMFKYAE